MRPVTLCLLLLPSFAFAQPMDLFGSGPKSIAMGGVQIAADDDVVGRRAPDSDGGAHSCSSTLSSTARAISVATSSGVRSSVSTENVATDS